MNEKLNDLFYKEKLGVASQATFINQVKNRYPDIKVVRLYYQRQQGCAMHHARPGVRNRTHAAV